MNDLSDLPDIGTERRMSTGHLRAWRDSIGDRTEVMKIEPGALLVLIDEVLDARARGGRIVPPTSR